MTHPLNEDGGPPARGIGYGIFGFAVASALLVGLALGYLGRPMITTEPRVEIVVTVTPNAVAQAQPAENSGQAAPTPSIMDFVLSDARHFQGQADAPVTLIEFSDFK
jgi:protein-disulfide isomerase